MTRTTLAAAAALLLAVTGCYTIRYERRGAADPGAPRAQMNHAFVGGLVSLRPFVDLAEVCPNGIVAVENEVTFVDALIQGVQFTGSAGALAVLHAPLWEPSTVRIVCARDGVTSPAANGKRKLKIAVLRLTPMGDVEPATVALLTEALAGELRKRAGLSVMAESDIAALLGMEKTKSMLGCTDAGCIAEVGGALGVDRIVHGSIGRVGASLLVNLSSLDPKKAAHASSVSERLKGSTDEGFLDALPRIVDDLLAEAN
jgi:TolB-like protein